MKAYICASANSKYMRYLYVMMYSLFQSNSKNEITMFIFQRDFTDADKACLNELTKKFQQTIKYIDIDERKYIKFPEKYRYSLEVYFRFEILDKIPSNMDRVLYLDVDMIVRNDLSELLLTNMGDCYFAVCQDMIVPELLPQHKVLFNRFNELKYFNSGMMLWNLPVIRSNGISFNDFVKAGEELDFELPMVDQDIFNYKFYDKVMYLPSKKWNFMVTKYVQNGWHNDDMENDAAILHFTGVNPWIAGPKAPIYKIWWEFAKKTPFYVSLLEEQLEKSEEYIFKKNTDGILPTSTAKGVNACLDMLLTIKGLGIIRKEFSSSDKKYCVWGYGFLGKRFFDVIRHEHADEYVVAIMDNNPAIGQKASITTPFHNDFNWLHENQEYIFIITPSYENDKIFEQIRNACGNEAEPITLLRFLKRMLDKYKEM